MPTALTPPDRPGQPKAMLLLARILEFLVAGFFLLEAARTLDILPDSDVGLAGTDLHGRFAQVVATLEAVGAAALLFSKTALFGAIGLFGLTLAIFLAQLGVTTGPEGLSCLLVLTLLSFLIQVRRPSRSTVNSGC